MVGVGEQMTGSLHEFIRLGLQVAPTALFDFGSEVGKVLGESGEESIDLVTHLSSGA